MINWDFMFIPNANKEAHLGHLWVCMHTLGFYHYIKHNVSCKCPGHFNVRMGILFEEKAEDTYKESYTKMMEWLWHSPDFVIQVPDNNFVENLYSDNINGNLYGFRKLIYLQSVPWLIRGHDINTDPAFNQQERLVASFLGLRIPQIFQVPMLSHKQGDKEVIIGRIDVPKEYLVSTYLSEDVDTFLTKFIAKTLKDLGIEDIVFNLESKGVDTVDRRRNLDDNFNKADLKYDEWRFRFWARKQSTVSIADHSHTFCSRKESIVLEENWYD